MHVATNLVATCTCTSLLNTLARLRKSCITVGCVPCQASSWAVDVKVQQSCKASTKHVNTFIYHDIGHAHSSTHQMWLSPRTLRDPSRFVNLEITGSRAIMRDTVTVNSGHPRYNRQFWKSRLSFHLLLYLSNPWTADNSLLHVTESFAVPNCTQTILNYPDIADTRQHHRCCR